jgi:hypothetical protein
MANSHTQLYASQGNGGKATVTIGEIGAATVAPATTSTAGVVKEATAVANCTVAADGTSAGTQLNALLAALRTAGVLSST